VTLAGCQWLVGIRERSSAGTAGTSGIAGGGAGVVGVGGAGAGSGGKGGAATNGGKGGASGAGAGASSGASGTDASGGVGGTRGICDDPSGEAGAGGAIPDDAGDPVQRQSLAEVTLEDASCMRTGGSTVSCAARVESTSGDVDIEWPTWSGGIVCGGTMVYAYDDRGNRYLTSGVRFASQTHADRCGLPVTLIGGVTAELRYDFDEVSTGATEITLLPFRPVVAGVLESVAFRRLPLAGECAGWAPEGDALGREVDSVESQGVSIRAYPCRIQGADELECPLVFTSESDDRVVAFPTRSGGITCGGGTASAFDDQGNELVATRVDVANETKAAPCNFDRLLVRAVPTLVRYRFGQVDSDVETITQVRLAGFGVDGVAEEVQLTGLPLER
jgi:hypothetical protein